MINMKLEIITPGALTSVQDLGRWGFQAIGMPVSGAMDAPALTRGNILLGNDQGAAGLEITMNGPSIKFDGDGAVAITGADISPMLNAKPVNNWEVIAVKSGDVLSFGGLRKGLRAYLCVSGGIDVPLVMGSRSTYMKAGIGGHEGRKLQKGDVLSTGTPGSFKPGMICPEHLRPDYDAFPLRTVLGPQDDYITPEGVRTFLETEYRISPSSDRMGSRMEADTIIKHVKGSDIISDAIPMGAVQIPGQGVPIVMMADRQTTGGYVKIGVVHALDVARLSQFMPGSRVRFTAITQEQGIEISRQEAVKLSALCDYVKQPPTTTIPTQTATTTPTTPTTRGAMNVIVNGEKFRVEWEKLS